MPRLARISLAVRAAALAACAPRSASLILLLAALSACSNWTDLPVAPSSFSPRAALGGDASAVSGAQTWGGRCRFAGQRLSPTLVRVTGVCQLAHLGRVAYVNLQTLVPGPVIQFTNTTTYTAANGDELYTIAAGTGTPTDGGARAILAATETVTGGTGRFARAAGQAALAGTVFFTGPAAGTGFYDLTGTLDYTASDRAP